MVRYLVVLSVAAAIVTTGPVTAQDCNALIAHGLRNIEIKQSSQAAVATKYYRNCGYKFAELSDTILADVEAEVFGSGAGSAGFSRAQREKRIDQWCVLNKEAAQSAQNEYQQSQSIMAAAVTAWSDCNALASKGVHTRPIISADQRTVTLSVSYTGPTTGGVEFYGITSEGFTCDTRVPSVPAAAVAAAARAGNPLTLGPAAISVECKRNVAAKTISGEEYSVLERGTISVRTASDPYQMFFPEQTDPPLPIQVAKRIEADLAMAKRLLPPVGSIVAFALRPEEISRLAPEWLPADGRVVHDPLSPLDGRRLPDTTGRFLQGIRPDQDASLDAAVTVGGSLSIDQEVSITGDTGLMVNVSCQTPNEDDPRNKFPDQNMAVWDTDTRESGCTHKHALLGAGYKLKADLPSQPYRGVVYLVRAR